MEEQGREQEPEHGGREVSTLAEWVGLDPGVLDRPDEIAAQFSGGEQGGTWGEVGPGHVWGALWALTRGPDGPVATHEQVKAIFAALAREDLPLAGAVLAHGVQEVPDVAVGMMPSDSGAAAAVLLAFPGDGRGALKAAVLRALDRTEAAALLAELDARHPASARAAVVALAAVDRAAAGELLGSATHLDALPEAAVVPALARVLGGVGGLAALDQLRATDADAAREAVAGLGERSPDAAGELLAQLLAAGRVAEAVDMLRTLDRMAAATVLAGLLRADPFQQTLPKAFDALGAADAAAAQELLATLLRLHPHHGAKLLDGMAAGGQMARVVTLFREFDRDTAAQIFRNLLGWSNQGAMAVMNALRATDPQAAAEIREDLDRAQS